MHIYTIFLKKNNLWSITKLSSTMFIYTYKHCEQLTVWRT